MTVTAAINSEDGSAVLADDGVPVIHLEPAGSPDDPWRLEFDLRGVDLFWPDCAGDDSRRRSSLSAAPGPRSFAPRPQTHAPRPRRRTSSQRTDRGSVDESDEGDADPPVAAAGLRSGRAGAAHQSIVQASNEPVPRPPRFLAPNDSPTPCVLWIVELVRAGLVGASELLAAAVQAMIEEQKRGGTTRDLSLRAQTAAAPSAWQTPPVAARTVGVPVKIVRAMIKTKQIGSRLRNRTSNPKQPKFLVNTDELRAAVGRDQTPARERETADDVLELARRIRVKAARR